MPVEEQHRLLRFERVRIVDERREVREPMEVLRAELGGAVEAVHHGTIDVDERVVVTRVEHAAIEARERGRRLAGAPAARDQHSPIVAPTAPACMGWSDGVVFDHQ